MNRIRWIKLDDVSNLDYHHPISLLVWFRGAMKKALRSIYRTIYRASVRIAAHSCKRSD